MKYHVPRSIAGSPAWHRSNLQDLLCCVRAWGMPHFFLTLTADECSNLRWSEIDHLEDVLGRFDSMDKTMSWQDAPVECARHFVHRTKKFMQEFITTTENDTASQRGHKLLGRVQHYLIRYECQGRGSLHAHIILWVHPEDVDHVASEITATMPAEFDSNDSDWIPPTDVYERKLFDIVKRKQMHYVGLLFKRISFQSIHYTISV